MNFPAQLLAVAHRFGITPERARQLSLTQFLEARAATELDEGVRPRTASDNVSDAYYALSNILRILQAEAADLDPADPDAAEDQADIATLGQVRDLLMKYIASTAKEVGTPEDLEDVAAQAAWMSSVEAYIADKSGRTQFVESAVPLEEKAVRGDGTIRVKVIAPGWGSSGYYSEAVLKRDGPKAFPKGTHMYWDHPTKTEAKERPERSVTELAAVTEGMAVYQENGPQGPGLYADARVMKPYQPAIDELAPHIGVSIRAYGSAKQDVAEGRKGPVIQSIDEGESIDFVTRAGAGGEITQLFEAARGRKDEPITEDVNVSEQELKEARDRAAAAERERDEERQKTARLQEAVLLREARDVVVETLAKADIPDITRARLAEAIAKNPPTKDGALDREALVTRVTEAVKDEVDYLAKIRGSGRVTGLGGSSAPDAVEESEKQIGAALGRAFGLSESQTKIAAAGRSH